MSILHRTAVPAPVLLALLVAGTLSLLPPRHAGAETSHTASLTAADLPMGTAPPPVEFPHFPSRFHAFVWRNWELVPPDRLAEVTGARPEDILRTGRAMGLSGPPSVTEEQRRRSAVTLIRRNWHLLPYEQLLQLLGWNADEMAFALREDDFLFIKLGRQKPRCEPVRYQHPDETARKREAQIAALLREEFPEGVGVPPVPLYAFVDELSRGIPSAAPPPAAAPDPCSTSSVSPSSTLPLICYSYFALYGDPLLDPALDPYTDALLARLAEVGVTGVWLQGVLNRLAPFPWDDSVSRGWQTRMENLRRLSTRARRHGIGVYLYLNEPRAMPLAFHERHPGLRGVTEDDYAALCTSSPQVQAWIGSAIESICREAPDLGGFFTISGSENLTHCWSHHRGGECPRCAGAGGAAVVADLHSRIAEAIGRTTSTARLIAWDWGWAPGWAEEVAARLPKNVALMSTSEWDVPIDRGGVATTVGEYSMSAMGPGPRARQHWSAARSQGLPVMAKIQAGNTWELSAVPFIPVTDLVARHCAALRDLKVPGFLLGWTLGGYPSPNLEVATLIARTALSPDKALQQVAARRYGAASAPAAVDAWKSFSAAFQEFPFHTTVVYNAPLQTGPANLLWEKPTGMRATMVGFPYDDLDTWRAVYPADVYTAQLLKVADGFDTACRTLSHRIAETSGAVSPDTSQRAALEELLRVGEAAAIHFRSAANQAAFAAARNRLLASASPPEAPPVPGDREIMEHALRREIDLARRLKRIQERDSRIGFEASNQYYYTPLDLAEKILNCRNLLDSRSAEPGNGKALD